jgi:hypothetical protein
MVFSIKQPWHCQPCKVEHLKFPICRYKPVTKNAPPPPTINGRKLYYNVTLLELWTDGQQSWTQLTQLARKYTSNPELCVNRISQLDFRPHTTKKCVFLFWILPKESHNPGWHILSKLCAQKVIWIKSLHCMRLHMFATYILTKNQYI